MKTKAVLFAFALSGVSVFGQGVVTFQNSAISTPIKWDPTGGVDYVNIPAGGQLFSFYFKYGSSLQYTSQTYFNNDALAGRITTIGTADIVLPNAPGGVATSFQLFGFSTAAGSFENAKCSIFAVWYQSSIITATPSVSPTPGYPLFGVSQGSQFQGFNFHPAIDPCPEPSTIALGVLGAGSLLFFRRRK